MPIAGRERDASYCQASGLLPVHVVLVTPILVPPYWPAVSSGPRHCPVDASSLVFFVSTGGICARAFNSDGCIAMKLNKIHVNSSKHNGYHVARGPLSLGGP